ncbi:MAG: hypothetical protein AAGC60_02030 [Acidobacteriota bacterium]
MSDLHLDDDFGTTAQPRSGRRGLWIFLGLIALGAGALVALGPSMAPDAAALQAELERREVVLSQVYEVDDVYPSMTGPSSQVGVQVGDPDADELVWITGYRATMVGPDGTTQLPQEFMCHSNLDVDAQVHQMLHGPSPSFNPRLFTLSQGQLEIEFPPGFGIPMRSTETLSLTTQVLNLNLPAERLAAEPVQVRHRVEIEFVRDADLAQSDLTMTPLVPTAAFGLALLEGEDGYYGVASPDEEMHGSSCLTGEAASAHAYDDPHGRVFTGHWKVPPGRQVNETLVTELLRVPYETTIHYIAVHLHPFAESLTLRNLTTGEVLFESRAQNFDDKIGLAHVDAFSSVEGVRIDPDHEYQLVSVYENTSGAEQDSMAVMYIYLRDHETEERLRERVAYRAVDDAVAAGS